MGGTAGRPLTFTLIYHDVARPEDREQVGFPGPLAARYKLDPDRFLSHLDAIAATGVPVGLVGDDGAGAQAALTFDDGGLSALQAADALEARGWRGHFFITTGRIGTPGFMGADDVRQLAARGHCVGSHSHSHPTYMGKLPRDEIADEWRVSRAVLGKVLGAAPTMAAVPGGLLSEVVIEEAAAAGYGVLMTSEPSTRLRRHEHLTVVGRYTVWAATPASRAAGYACGAAVPRARLWLQWQAKGVPKRMSPGLYQALRRVRAGSG